MDTSVQWDMNVECGRHTCSVPYASIVEYMYTSVYGPIVDCIEFIWGIYTYIIVSYLHIK